MTRIRALKLVLYVAALLPLAWGIFAVMTGRVTGDEVKFMQHVTGDTVLTTLLITLSITPIRRLTGWNELIHVRRQIGLTAFWYAVLHLVTYVVFDQSLSPTDIAEDIAKHPWVLVGFTGFLLLVPLAITSTKGWVRRLGGKRWQRLHRLIYPAAVAGVLHYLWLVKKDVTVPLYYAGALGVLFALRFVVRRGHRRAPRPREPQEPGALSSRTEPT